MTLVVSPDQSMCLYDNNNVDAHHKAVHLTIMTGGKHLQPTVLVLTNADETLVDFAARVLGQLPDNWSKSGRKVHLRLVLDEATRERNRLKNLRQRKSPVLELGQGPEDADEAYDIGIIPAQIFGLEIFAVRFIRGGG